MKRQLLCGCGINKTLRNGPAEDLVTLDNNPDRGPDIVWDLTKMPWPFIANEFDEVHAYHVLEHLWSQGDYPSFFRFFTEVYRITKPEAMVFIVVPTTTSPWLFGDPSHKSIIHPLHFQFLSQAFYRYECDELKGTGSDFRNIYAADFETTDVRVYQDETAIFLKRI